MAPEVILSMRKSGLDIIGDVRWGTHFCQFYKTKKDLIDILVPYFKAGLENNEFCMWVTSAPLNEEEAEKALRKAVPDLNRYQDSGQIEIIPYTDWYVKGGAFSSQRVLNGWVDKLNQALAKGYDGLRLTGNTFWLEEAAWQDFTNYEAEVDSVIGNYRMIAICTYSLEKCSATEVVDVVRNHEFALIKYEGKWEIIESSELKRAREALHAERERLAVTLASIGDGVIATDTESNVVLLNQVAEKLTGWTQEEARGVTLSEVFNIINEASCEPAGDPVARALKTGTIVGLANHTALISRDGTERNIADSCAPIRDSSGTIIGAVLVFRDITEQRRAEEVRRELHERINRILESINDAFFALDNEWRFTYVNQRAEELLLRTKDELLGKVIWDEFPEAVGLTFYNEYHKAIKEKVPVAFEEFYPPLNAWFEVHAYPYQDGLSVYFADANERKQFEKEREQLYKQAGYELEISNLLLKAADTLAESIELQGVLDRLADIISEVIGRSRIHISLVDGKTNQLEVMATKGGPGDPVGTRFSIDQITPQLGQAVFERRPILIDYDATDVPAVSKERAEKLDIKLLLLAPIVSDNKVIGIFSIDEPGSRREFTQRDIELVEGIVSQAAVVIENARLIEAERNIAGTLQTTMESTNAHIAYLDSGFNFIMVNSTYEKGSGHTRDELIGRNHFELFPNEENEAIFKKVRDTGELIEYKAKPFEFADQPWRGVTYWDWTLTPVKDPSDRVVGLVLSLVDVTDVIRAKELSDALNKINATISSTFNVDEIMQQVVTEAGKAIGSETAALVLYEDNYWVAKYLYNLPQEYIGLRFTGVDIPHAKHTSEARQAMIINDASTDKRVNPEVMERLGVRSVLAMPLIIKGDIVGIIFFNHHTVSVTFTEAQIDFANKLATSISLALENARLYEAERNIADTLQEALLTMPQKLPGVDFGHLYHSATESAKVGGDFYDIFEIEPSKIGVIVGDVSGKGIEASALTSLMKNTVRAYAHDGASPASIMSKTNNMIIKSTGLANFITAFFGILDTKTGQLTYCSAGHPQALLKRNSLDVSLLNTKSPLIGAFASLDYVDEEITLEDGDILILYTDGVIEARNDDIASDGFFSQERFISFVKSLGQVKAKEIPRAIFDHVMEYTSGKLADDLALLAISLTT
ncbi:MAG: MEDS domain-containing protein [Actinobacteria bacterium]|nr:MEDS domain-containing protein [Actinomycetota bacterium]